MILFTTITGAAQGLLLALVGLQVFTSDTPQAVYLVGAAVVLAMAAVGLVAASFHLGHPLRAWRAAAMWRTSWLSREVIVLPLFMAVVAGWALMHLRGTPSLALGLVASALALLLYLCTGMIYAAVKVIREWATPLVPLNFALLGLASGLMVCTLLVGVMDDRRVAQVAVACAVALALATASRLLTHWRNRRLPPKTTVQTALGIRHPRIVQTSQGMTAPTFGTREFFHGQGAARVRWVQLAALVLGALVPLTLLVATGVKLTVVMLGFLIIMHAIGLISERWWFFAEGKHPQNVYQQSR
jgi:sulfite dehydrogenase (quinone) subunit SoeC